MGQSQYHERPDREHGVLALGTDHRKQGDVRPEQDAEQLTHE